MVPALVTPFGEDERIDFGAWQTIIDTLIAAGMDGLLVGGSTGEFFALSTEERLVSLRFVKQAAAGRVPLYGNVGAVTTREAVALAQQAEEIGIDCLVAITPYFLKPSQDELVEHYCEICHSVRAPVFAYNLPMHGGVEIEPATLARIAARSPNLAGIKDSSGTVERLAGYLGAVKDREFAVFVGFENLIAQALEMGCVGSMNACSNIVPALFVALYRAFQEGKREEVARLQALAAQLSGLLPTHTFPAVTKEAMRMAGLPAGVCRKPVGPMPAEPRARLAAVMARFGQEGFLPHAHQPSGLGEESVPPATRP
jgi:4-hydroxy-tetrahydrodipicolinate synthase